MSLRIEDVENNRVVTMWDNTVLVASFSVRSGNSYDSNNANKRGDRYVYFGFDWLRLNNVGEITQIHNISINKCTHLYESGDTYSANNGANCIDFLKKEFKIFKSQNGNTVQYSSQSWLHLPRLNEYIDNLRMKFDGTYQNVPLTFEIPIGITLEYKNQNTYIPISNNTPVIFTSSDCQIKVSASSAVGKVEINVKNPNNDIIGSLGVYAYEQKNVNLGIWTLVENPSGNKSNGELQNARNALMYNQSQLNDLQKKLDSVFNQVGINIVLQDAGSLTYDPDNNIYSPIVKIKAISSEIAGRNFFDKIKENNNQLETFNGKNLLLTDAKCEYSTTTATGNPATGSLSGLGDIGSKNSIVFNQAYTNYGVCVHEIGHTFGLIHSFYDNDSDSSMKNTVSDLTNTANRYNGEVDITILDMKGVIINIEDYFITYPNDRNRYEPIRQKLQKYDQLTNDEKAVNEEIKAKYIELKNINELPAVKPLYDEIKQYEIILNSSTLLFDKDETKNLMDYTENSFNFLFKWQWKIGR